MPKNNVNKLSDDLMSDLEKLRSGEMKSITATQICRHANTVMKAENIKLQYKRIEERVNRQNL